MMVSFFQVASGEPFLVGDYSGEVYIKQKDERFYSRFFFVDSGWMHLFIITVPVVWVTRKQRRHQKHRSLHLASGVLIETDHLQGNYHYRLGASE